MSKFVGILDSGIGGLSILKACADRMLNTDFVYLADTKYAPYGNKSKYCKLLIMQSIIL